MVGAALGTVLGALAWVLVQLLPDAALESWGWRVIFWASVLVTLGAYVIRRKMAESPSSPSCASTSTSRTRRRSRSSRSTVPGTCLKVVVMNWGVSTQSYTYQVFMASYLVTVVGADKASCPTSCSRRPVRRARRLRDGTLSDRFGRRRMFLVLAGAAVLLPVPAFMAAQHRLTLWIIVVMALGFITAAHGITAVTMSYFPEMFGTRYRYAGVTLGREFSAIIGGGVAPLLAAALMAWFADSWVPVALYMMITMLASLLVARTVPETVNRDLQLPTDAQPGEARPLS